MRKEIWPGCGLNTRNVAVRKSVNFCPRVGPSIRHTSHAFFAFLGILRVGKFVFEHAPAQIIIAPARIITAPAQFTTAPAQPPATGVVVYTALFLHGSVLSSKYGLKS